MGGFLIAQAGISEGWHIFLAHMLPYSGRQEGQHDHSRRMADPDQRDQNASEIPDDCLHALPSKIQQQSSRRQPGQ